MVNDQMVNKLFFVFIAFEFFYPQGSWIGD